MVSSFRANSEGSLVRIPIDLCQCHWSCRWRLPLRSGEEQTYSSHLLLLDWGWEALAWSLAAIEWGLLKYPATLCSFCLSPPSSGQSSPLVASFPGLMVVLSRDRQGEMVPCHLSAFSAIFELNFKLAMYKTKMSYRSIFVSHYIYMSVYI